MGVVVLSFLVSVVLVFAGLFFLFRKFSTNKNPLRSLYYWLTAFVATPSLYIGFLFIWFFISSSYERKAFDMEKWTESRDSRYLYVEDLVDDEKLIGLTSSELKSMLGEADHEDDSTMIFYIGYSPKYFLNMDPDWLETTLINGRVSKVNVRE